METTTIMDAGSSCSGGGWTANDERWAAWWARRYSWALGRGGALDLGDLQQAASIGILIARKKWAEYQTASANQAAASDPDHAAADPDHAPGGAPVAWATFSAYYIRNELRGLVGIRCGQLPPVVRSLDAPLAADDPDGPTVGDTLPDGSPPIAAQIEDAETRRAIMAAVTRIADDDAREAITLLYLEGVPAAMAAQMMGTTREQVHRLQARGLSALRRDGRLRAYRRLDAETIWAPAWGVGRFQQTRKSGVEVAVEHRERVREKAMQTGEDLSMQAGKTAQNNATR